jgi:hypothetical protein
MIQDFPDLLNDETPIEDVKLDLEQVKHQVPSFSNEKLCEMIVCDRYFGFDQKISIICMEELAKRRSQGDLFAFEGYIDQKYKELPVLDFKIPDLRTALQTAINFKNMKR